MPYYVQVVYDGKELDLFFDATDELDAAARAYYLYPTAKITGVRRVNTNSDRVNNVRFIDFNKKSRNNRHEETTA